jgi:5-hydroxyisourate hydrolase-like protein (transthyretin family)
MAKQQISVLKTIIKWVSGLLIFIGVPVFINIFSQPKYGVFDGMTIFFGKYKIIEVLILFGLAYAARVFVKKQKPEPTRGVAAFLLGGLAAALLFTMLRGILQLHALSFMYLTGWVMFLSFYFLDELPGIADKIKTITAKVTKTAGHILKWVWRALLVLAAPFILLAIAKDNYQFNDVFQGDNIGLGIMFFSAVALWRYFVKKQKFSFLLSAGIFILAGIIAMLLRGLILRLPFVDLRIYNYFSALIAAYLSGHDEAVLSFLQKTRDKIWGWLGPKVKNATKGFMEFVGKYSKKSAGKIMEVKNKRIKVIVVIAAIAGAIGLFNLGKFIYDRSFVFVLALSPKGEVGENIMITAEFSKPVDLKVKDVSELKCFTIIPALKGKYSFENKKTVVFSPDEPLLPSTDYEVSMNTGDYFTAIGKRVIGSPKTQFHTPYLKIVDQRFFANKDILKNEEKEVVGEVNFNYPVDAKELENAVEVKKIINPNCNSMTRKESPMKFRIEPSESPTRFYIRIQDISRSYDCQEISVKIAAGLKCPSCAKGMENDFQTAVNISQKMLLAIESVSPWQQEGDTSIALRFNMPVSAEQVKKYVTIIRRATINRPAETVPFTVKTEYCYSVFSAAFEPNLIYDVNVAQAIVSKNGDPMKSAYGSSVKLQDLPSSLEYAEEGELLTPAGDMNVGLRVMNLDSVNVRLFKIFKNNLVYYLRYNNTGDYGNQVFNSYFDIKGGKVNQEITEYINFRKFSEEPYKGIFVSEVSDSKNSWESKRKIIRCTNLGMIAKTSGKDLHVKVMNINTLAPAADITVKLMSTTNQVMKELKTDSAGKTVIKNWREAMYNFYPYLVMAESGEDFSYLVFDNSMLDNYRFDTSGEPSALAYNMKAFVTSDRGLYRPGETVNLTAVIRNSEMAIPPGIMIENRITGAQGEVIQSDKKNINAQGMETFVLKLPLSAMTGEYRSEIRINYDYVIGSATFKVEEFIPDKLVVAINAEVKEINAGSPLLFNVQANQMFGPPAAGNKTETEVKFIDYTFQSKKYKDYIFRDPQKTFAEKFERLGGQNLDALGKYFYDVPVPSGANPPSAMLAEIYTEIFDDGGRPVGAYKSIPVHAYKYYLGLKMKDPRKIYKRGDRVELDIAAINPADEPQNVKNVEVIVKRKVWYSIFRTTRWNRQQYDSSYYEEAIIYKTIDVNGQATLAFDADVEGEYYIYVGNETRMRTGLTINVSGPGFTTYDSQTRKK